MPGFDGTGPMGQGPMTGRGMGYCAVPLPPAVSAPTPVTPAVVPVYPAATYPVAAPAYGFSRIGYQRVGWWPRFFGRGFGRRGGRGRWW